MSRFRKICFSASIVCMCFAVWTHEWFALICAWFWFLTEIELSTTEAEKRRVRSK